MKMKKKYKKAFEYYIISADLGESWAANQIGEFYRKGIAKPKDLKKAFEYYNISAESSRFTLCAASKYNLAKYFYKNGNVEIGINKDLNKAIELLEDVADNLLEASEELLYIYYALYLKSGKKNRHYLDKLIFYKNMCERNSKYNAKIKEKIEKLLLKIHDNVEGIHIP